MNLVQTKAWLRVPAISAGLLVALTVYAGPSHTPQRLQTAYSDLSSASKRYQGHRTRALEQIRAAAQELKLPLQRTGRVPAQTQVNSDLQLRAAARLLARTKADLSAKERQKIGGRLDRAVREIHRALKTK